MKIFATGLNWIWVTILVLLLDQASKFWIVHHLIFAEPRKILPIFNLTLAYNTGAAFSFLHSASGWQNVVLGSLAVVISILIIYWLYQLPRREWFASIAFCLVMGGALGNAIDRIRFGYVIDFFNFHINDWHFAIFNVADSAICVGAFMLCWHWLRS